jgi:hypothetical protein
MIEMVILRGWRLTTGACAFEIALGHSGEYPRVAFRITGALPALSDEAATLRDVLEELGEELFNIAPHADGRDLSRPPALLQGFSDSSPTLPFEGEMDGGGWGGPVGDGQ